MSTIAKRRTIRFTVTAIAIAGSILLGSAPARAHDQLLESSPTPDERLATAPTEVVLTFVDEIMPIGTAVSVIDESDTEWAVGDPVLDGATVTTALRAGMPDGAYQVRWRVVAVDGHPISDIYPFVVGAEKTHAPSPAVETSPPSSAPEPTAAAADDAASAPGVLRTVLIGAGGAAAALALFWAIRRWRRGSAVEASSSQQSAGPSSGSDTNDR